MTIAPALYSSVKTEWETPPELFEQLKAQFSFTLDVCATRQNRKCAAHFTPEQDGLRQRWTGTCWMNPPYGRALGAWIRKARKEGVCGATVVCLVPARTDTVWWHSDVMKAREIRLLRGRLTFVGAQAPAPFPSAVVIFKRNQTPRRTTPRVLSWDWRVAAQSRHAAGPHRAPTSRTVFS